MDIQAMYDSAKKLNEDLQETFPMIKKEDEKFLKQVISFYHVNMTPNKKFDIDKIKKDYLEQTSDIIDYMDGLYETTQIYFKIIESMNKELQKKS
jgi:predicted adenine nucleotide alpha hydrolase (AANH) superfamily ATPase